MTTIAALQHSKCTGCSACAAVCPFDAITLKENKEGFVYPIIDEEKCTQCGLCAKTCPAFEYKFSTPSNPDCYAVWAEKDIREKSSSGGMFTVLAESILKKNGVVVGAAWKEDFGVEHIIISKSKEIQKLRSSKYVQSNIGKNIFRTIKQNLNDGKDVLFTGCPCQVAGLKKYLVKDYDNLITVDLVCHGVPSPSVLKKYLSEISMGKKITSVDFRDKKYYGWQTITAVKFDDGSEYVRNYWDSTWYNGFLGGIFVRDCCGICPYAKSQRVGDITLGDFWQIHRFKPEYNDWRGTGLVLLNTDKGKKIFKQLRNKLPLCEPMPLECAKKYNGQLNAPTKLSEHRKMFFDKIEKSSFADSLAPAIDKYDIGVMGFWYSNNYGSILTYYVLRQILLRMGQSVLMIDKPLVNGNLDGEHSDTPARIFAKEHNYNISKAYQFADMNMLNKKCHTFIAGSDQLWNYGIAKIFRGTLFLDFVHDDKKRIAYSTSFGHDGFWAPEDYAKMAAYFISKFDYISVREESAVELCAKHFYSKADMVLDPLLIAEKSDYEGLIAEAQPTFNGEYFLAYILDPSEEKTKAIKYLRKYFGCTSVNIVDGLPENFDKNAEAMGLDNVVSGVRVQEWLHYYKNAKFVFTDSFHGTCLALYFNKQFFSMVNEYRGATRFDTLKNIFNLGDRIISNADDVRKIKQIRDINYKEVNKILNEKKSDSLNWLSKAVLSPKKQYEELPSEIKSRLRTTNDYIWSLKKRINVREAELNNKIKQLEEELKKRN